MTDKLDNDVERSVRGLRNVLSWQFPGGTEENHEKLWPRKIAGDPAEIRTEHLPNTSADRYL
jgi:hypothetical protein